MSAPITIIVQQECFGRFKDFFPQSQSVDDADLVIIVSSVSNCPPGALGFASACTRDQFDRHLIGFIHYCIADDAERRFWQENLIMDQDQADFTDNSLVAIHEVGHVLGVNLEA